MARNKKSNSIKPLKSAKPELENKLKFWTELFKLINWLGPLMIMIIN